VPGLRLLLRGDEIVDSAFDTTAVITRVALRGLGVLADYEEMESDRGPRWSPYCDLQ
jgi:hypothetical protein